MYLRSYHSKIVIGGNQVTAPKVKALILLGFAKL